MVLQVVELLDEFDGVMRLLAAELVQVDFQCVVIKVLLPLQFLKGVSFGLTANLVHIHVAALSHPSHEVKCELIIGNMVAIDDRELAKLALRPVMGKLGRKL